MSNDNVAPHLFSCHIFDAIIWNLALKNIDYLSIQMLSQNPGLRASLLSFEESLVGLHSETTRFSFLYNSSGLDGSTGRTTSQIDLVLYLLTYRLFNLSEPWLATCKMEVVVPAHCVTLRIKCHHIRTGVWHTTGTWYIHTWPRERFAARHKDIDRRKEW